MWWLHFVGWQRTLGSCDGWKVIRRMIRGRSDQILADSSGSMIHLDHDLDRQTESKLEAIRGAQCVHFCSTMDSGAQEVHFQSTKGSLLDHKGFTSGAPLKRAKRFRLFTFVDGDRERISSARIGWRRAHRNAHRNATVFSSKATRITNSDCRAPMQIFNLNPTHACGLF